MFKYLFFLALCSHMIYSMQQQIDNKFYVDELVGPFDYSKPSTTTDPVHFINTACMYMRFNVADTGNYIPFHIGNNETSQRIATHLLLQAVSSKTSHTKDYVKLLLTAGANPLGRQKITMIQKGKAQDVGGLQNGATLYSIAEIYTSPCETPLRLAMQYRNVPAVKAMLELQPDLAGQQIHSPANGKTYAGLCAWLVENAQREKEKLLQMNQLMQQALQKIK